MKIKLLALFTGVFCCMSGRSQDIQFSQFYAASLYQNPAFAGSRHENRFTLHSRVQWLGLEADYNTIYASADFHLKNHNSGLGGYILRDVQGESTISSTEVKLQYAYEVLINKSITFRPGIQAGITSRALDYTNLFFPDQYDNSGYLGNTNDVHNGKDQTLFFDASFGMVTYTSNFWFGFTAHHLNRPNQSLVDNNDRLPIKYSYVTGYLWEVVKRDKQTLGNHEVSLLPTIHYKHQGKSDQLDLGVYLNYDMYSIGMWYRGLPVIKQYKTYLQNNESFTIMTGIKLHRVNIYYSYDFVTSRLTQAKTFNAHEIHLTFIAKGSQNREFRRLPCPKF